MTHQNDANGEPIIHGAEGGAGGLIGYVKDPKTGIWFAPETGEPAPQWLQEALNGVAEAPGSLTGLRPYNASTGQYSAYPAESPIGSGAVEAGMGTPQLYVDPSSQLLYNAKGTLLPQYLQKALGGLGGAGTRLASDDPRYWQLQYDQLAQQYMNSGLDAESARKQALASLIANRNNTATDVAKTSSDVAKNLAEFAANPRDTYAEAIYRNQVGGSTPFGDTGNAAFGEYGKALAAKVGSIFQPVAADLNAARGYRDQQFPVDFTGTSPATQVAFDRAGVPAAAPPPAAPNELAGALQWLQAMGSSENPTQAGQDFRKWVTPASAAKGGTFNFDTMFSDRAKPGASPSSSEGGTNLNIHERAVIMGESGHIYGTLGEKRPDGTVRAEQLQIKPLKSEVEKDKKLEEGNKAIVETQKKTLASFAGGGTATSSPSLDEMTSQYSLLLQRLTGESGGGGTSTPFGGTRNLAGAPANALLADPYLKGVTEGVYSSPAGAFINPEQLWADIAKFTPKSAKLWGQTMPGQVSWL